MMPTREDVERLSDADAQHDRLLRIPRSWWALIWVGDRWRLVYDPPSPR